MGRENFLIKLSEVKVSEDKKGTVTAPVYVNPSHIACLEQAAEGTIIRLAAQTTVVVAETPEQIEKKGGQYAVLKFISN